MKRRLDITAMHGNAPRRLSMRLGEPDMNRTRLMQVVRLLQAVDFDEDRRPERRRPHLHVVR